jgi:hypothetical protein
MTDHPDDKGQHRIAVAIEPAELEKLRLIGEQIKATVDAFRSMVTALAPALRQFATMVSEVEAKHGEFIREASNWEVSDTGTTAKHKPTGSVVPIDVARQSIQKELARRQRDVYETETEPRCDREGCPEACDQSCEADPEEAEEEPALVCAGLGRCPNFEVGMERCCQEYLINE